MFATAGCEVALLARSPAEADALNSARENKRHCPGLIFPDRLQATADAEALATAELVLLAVPSQTLRDNLSRLAPAINPDASILSAVKGIEIDTGLLMTGVIEWFGIERERTLVLSGPNFASEIAAGLPAATVVAGQSRERCRAVQAMLNGPSFRVYTSDDPTGVQLGGALKNVIAIACGISDGLGYGENAKAALITRSLAEITRLGVAAGARAMTFLGLAGIGDLLLSCGSDLSRNRRLGLALGRGASLEEAVRSITGVIEGVATARAVPLLASRYGVEMPVCQSLFSVLYENKRPRDAVKELMSRAARPELDEV